MLKMVLALQLLCTAESTRKGGKLIWKRRWQVWVAKKKKKRKKEEEEEEEKEEEEE